jgi:hypothetical protein
MRGVLDRLGARAQAHWLEQADHSFHVPARSGRRDADVLTELLDATAHWIARIVAAPGGGPTAARDAQRR